MHDGSTALPCVFKHHSSPPVVIVVTSVDTRWKWSADWGTGEDLQIVIICMISKWQQKHNSSNSSRYMTAAAAVDMTMAHYTMQSWQVVGISHLLLWHSMTFIMIMLCVVYSCTVQWHEFINYGVHIMKSRIEQGYYRKLSCIFNRQIYWSPVSNTNSLCHKGHWMSLQVLIQSCMCWMTAAALPCVVSLNLNLEGFQFAHKGR